MHPDCAESICWDGLEEHTSALRAFLARRCRDVNEAEDVAQEALVRAARFRSRVQDERTLRSWILRVGSTVLRDHQRRERRMLQIEGGDEVLARREGRDPEPGQFGEDELFELEGQIVERAQLMAEIELALAEAEEQDREVLFPVHGGVLCRETADARPAAPLTPTRRKERLWRARQRLHRRLLSRVRCVVQCGDEFAPARLSETCTGGGALALAPEEPVSGARRAQRG